MPEIAEVEVTRKACEKFVGHRLTDVEILDEKITDNFDNLSGHTLEAVKRHGKRLGLLFDDDEMIICHLRMTGRLFLGRDKKARGVMTFDNGPLSFIDSRRFGTLTVNSAADLEAGLGPDLFNDWPITIQSSKSSRAIKAVILDQTVIAGIGNYLADESLWKSRINPARPANSLSKRQWSNLLDAAHETALTALGGGGLSMRDYLNPDGEAGQMGLELACYGRAGEDCYRCGRPLAKAKVGGRGTTYCRRCQRA